MNKKSKDGNQIREKIMEFLKKKEVKISPVSIDEIKNALDISSSSVVTYHLGVLEKEGRLSRDKKIARHIEVIK